ncbi:MAG: hypothetical protein HN337_04775 [Deltaproteobacteria bacterium]|jgi:hypothetical protein|nr:hypothetical protein [Deltaproteobacteria bacterium]
MQINDLKFKINTVSTDDSPAPSDTEMDQMLQESQGSDVEDYFEDSFGDPFASDATSNQKGCTGNSNPLNDYTLGDFGNISSAGVAGSDSILDFLENAPPSVNDLIANNEQAICYLDILKGRYEKFYTDISVLKTEYETLLDPSKNPEFASISANEQQLLHEKLSAAGTALTRCEQQLNALQQLESQMDNLYRQELSEGKDLNNDGWLGKPFRDYLIKKNEDGTISLLDAATKKAVPCPFLDPTYQPQLTNDDSLQIKTIEEAYNSGNYANEITVDEDGNHIYTEGGVDLFLGVNADKLGSSENFLGAFTELGIPQSLWVKKGDIESAEPYEFKYDEALGMERFSVYENWSSDGGIHQEVPADLKKYVQVEVTGAKLRSEPTGLKDVYNPDGGELYNHFIEFYNGQTLISRIRIEGTEVEGDHPLATPTDSNVNYIAASSLSFAFNGDRRTRPLEFDAGGWKSTGRFTTDRQTVLDTLGIDEPTSEQGMRAFNETIQAFTETSQTTDYFNGDGWQEQSNSFEEYYGDGYSDAYLPPDIKPGENDTLLEFRTGIMIHNMRGDIKGTAYNDIIQTLGVNEKTDYAKEHLPEEVQSALTGDPFYSNIVKSSGGNDVVVAGFGDNFITGATFVSVKSNPNDTNVIMTPELLSHGALTENTKTRNPKTYIEVHGGAETFIVNPEEDSPGIHKDDDPTEDEGEADKWNDSFIDDWFDINSNSVIYTVHPYGDEYTGSASFDDSMPMDKTAVGDAISGAQQAFYDELTTAPDVDEQALEATWNDVLTQQTTLDDEMNGFFDEMFGEMDSMLGELNLGPNT